MPSSSSFSVWLRRSQPSQPSRVRVVPLRLPEGASPGCQMTVLPFSLKDTLRLSGAKRPPAYTSESLPVVMVTPPPVSLTLNAGTGSRRFIMARLALSSNTPSSAHSMRMRRSVRTVKRALPLMTMASGAAAGSTGVSAADGTGSTLPAPRERAARTATATSKSFFIGNQF